MARASPPDEKDCVPDDGEGETSWDLTASFATGVGVRNAVLAALDKELGPHKRTQQYNKCYATRQSRVFFNSPLPTCGPTELVRRFADLALSLRAVEKLGSVVFLTPCPLTT